jgi:hypothetical protein
MVIVGICPECNNVLGIKQRALFCECPKCQKTVAVRDAAKYLDEMCIEPAYKTRVIDMCLDLESGGEVEKALGILAVLGSKHPQDEQVAYTQVRRSGYNPEVVRQYLSSFAQKPGEQPWAEEFLDNVMDMRFIMMLPNLIRFAENKLNVKKKRKYLEVLEGMHDDYALGQKESADGLWSMYALYSLSAGLNVGSILIFIVTSFALWINILICVGIFIFEFFLLFIHHHIFGNRLNISRTEHAFLTAFLASIPVAVGGIVIGWVL